MASESWDEARMLIMDKLSTHTNEISMIKKEQSNFNEKLGIAMESMKLNMMEMSVKLKMQGGIALFFVSLAITAVGWFVK